MVAVPTFELSGQATGALVPLWNCSGVQAARPFAAEGFRPIPCGRVTFAVRTVEVSWPFGSSSIGTCTSVVTAAGESTAWVPPSTWIAGLNGIVSQLLGKVPGGSGDSTNGEPVGKFGSTFFSESPRA